MSPIASSRSDFAQIPEEDGFAIVPHCLDEENVRHLGAHLGDTAYAIRNLLVWPVIRELAATVAVRTLVEAVLGKCCLAVKATLSIKPKKQAGRSRGTRT